MKKRFLWISALVLLVAVSVFVTVAYFTAEKETVNKITLGNIKIQLIEKTLDNQGQEIDFPEEPVAAMPGDEIVKKVTIKNIGANPAYIRVKLLPTVTPPIEGYAGLITQDLDTASWTKSENWYYFNSVLEPGESTDELMSKVIFDPAMENAYQDALYELKIEVEAVQSENNGSGPLSAGGWPTP